MKKYVVSIVAMMVLLAVAAGTAAVKKYRNDTYGIELSFPDSWNNYKVYEEMTNWADGITAPTLYVCLRTGDGMWNSGGKCPAGYAEVIAITIFTPAQLKKIEAYNKQNGDMPGEEISVFKKNNRYVISFSGPQALPSDLDGKLGEIDDVMKTLRFTK